MTWKQVTDEEEVAVLRLMLKNGTLQDRPNPNHDLSDPEVRQLRDELKYQYRWVTNKDIPQGPHTTGKGRRIVPPPSPSVLYCPLVSLGACLGCCQCSMRASVVNAVPT